MRIRMKKYYFITYQASNRDGSISTWNQVIDISPMQFIKGVSEYEEMNSGNYISFRVINTCEISLVDYIEYKDRF
jgi:hypothetical protein